MIFRDKTHNHCYDAFDVDRHSQEQINVDEEVRNVIRN